MSWGSTPYDGQLGLQDSTARNLYKIVKAFFVLLIFDLKFKALVFLFSTEEVIIFIFLLEYKKAYATQSCGAKNNYKTTFPPP
jgi:hypothetical protein